MHASLSKRRARQIAAAAPFAEVASAHAALAELGALQLDPMSRVERAHRLTVATRMRPPRIPLADTSLLDAGLWQLGEAAAFESFVHALCLLPISSWPMWRLHHEQRAAKLAAKDALAPVVDRVLGLVADSEDGATLGTLEAALDSRRTTGWNYSDTKFAVEYLVGAGRLIVSERRGGMRWFDLPERRVPASLLEAHLTADEIDDAKMRKTLEVVGIGTTSELAKHFRIRPPARGLAALRRLAERGEAVPAVLDDGALRSEARKIDRATLWTTSAALQLPAPTAVRWLGPFDNFMWDRDRILRIFGLHYRLEAYVPKAMRIHGPYALTALAGDRLVGRIDLRADRAARELVVEGWTPETGRVPVERLVASLDPFAKRLGLSEVRGAELLRSMK